MADEIIEEVWRNRDLLAAKYGHDLNAIVAAMQRRQRHAAKGLALPPSKGARSRRAQTPRSA